MTTDVDIDELLKQDEAELRAKKKRLKAFATTLDELRAAVAKATDAAAVVVDSGDLTRADVSKVFALSKGERASLFPAAARRSASPVSERSDASDAPADS